MSEAERYPSTDWFQPHFPVPNDILPEIFTHLDNRSINHCRLVCQQWSNSIVSSSKLMRRLTYKVQDANQLDSSYILPNIRSLSIQRPMPGPRQDVQEFFAAVGGTVERIDIQFPPRSVNLNSAELTFSALFTSCSRLQELNFLSRMSLEVVRELTPEEMQTAGSRIRTLGLTLDLCLGSMDSPFSSVKSFILSLPCLQLIKLLRLSVYSSDPELGDMLTEHMKRFVGSLKVISFPSEEPLTCSPTFFRLVSSALKSGVRLELNGPLAESELLLDGESVEDLDTETQGKTLKLVKNLQFTLRRLSSGHGIRKLVFCTELTKLSINFGRPPTPEELSVLRVLPKLQHLKLVGLWRNNEENANDDNQDQEVNRAQIDILQLQLPSLLSLSLTYQLFEPVAFASFYYVFPNLVELSLQNIRPLPDDLLHSLTKLNRLERLTLMKLAITDEMLVQPVQVCGAGGHAPFNVPAIGSLRHLKNLSITSCDLLTDVAIRDGIGLCEALEYVELDCRLDQFSWDCLNDMIEKRSLEKEVGYSGLLVASKRRIDLVAQEWAW